MHGLCLTSLNWCRFIMFVCYSKRMALASISVEYFCHKKLILSRRVLWNSQIKIIKLSVILKIWDEWCNRWTITQGAGTHCFFRMLTTVFLSYLKMNFTLRCLQTSLTCISFARNVMILQFLFLNWDWW